MNPNHAPSCRQLGTEFRAQAKRVPDFNHFPWDVVTLGKLLAHTQLQNGGIIFQHLFIVSFGVTAGIGTDVFAHHSVMHTVQLANPAITWSANKTHHSIPAF
uniref:Uncharacterized protein n=1 Tax=Anopheles maculatus TaxID=74869 RepID=A0A182T0F5_9DIPT